MQEVNYKKWLCSEINDIEDSRPLNGSHLKHLECCESELLNILYKEAGKDKMKMYHFFEKYNYLVSLALFVILAVCIIVGVTTVSYNIQAICFCCSFLTFAFGVYFFCLSEYPN